jgi:hypothetical protein
MTTEIGCPLFCDGCHKVMAYLDYGEFVNFEEKGESAGLCFDCDPDSAATVPSLFWQWREGEVFVLGLATFEVWTLPGGASKLVDVTHTRVHVRTLSCLSSSTNLHKTPLQSSGTGQHIKTNATCPDCPGWELVECNRGLVCLNCDKVWVGTQEIVIPAWIVDSQDRSGFSGDEDVSCVDCRYYRVQGIGEYCDYHYSLLQETFEDDELRQGYAS